MSVRVHRHGITHYLSHCHECDFQVDGITEYERAEARNEVRRHVQKTGHQVTIEAGSSTTYTKK